MSINRDQMRAETILDPDDLMLRSIYADAERDDGNDHIADVVMHLLAQKEPYYSYNIGNRDVPAILNHWLRLELSEMIDNDSERIQVLEWFDEIHCAAGHPIQHVGFEWGLPVEIEVQHDFFIKYYPKMFARWPLETVTIIDRVAFLSNRSGVYEYQWHANEDVRDSMVGGDHAFISPLLIKAMIDLGHIGRLINNRGLTLNSQNVPFHDVFVCLPNDDGRVTEIMSEACIALGREYAPKPELDIENG